MSNASPRGKYEPVNPSLGIGRVNMAHACGGLKRSPKAVLCYLALRYSEKRGYAWASVNDIANACSLSPATVKRALRVLNDPDGGNNLITRSLRDERVTKSRKSEIHWEKVTARATQFRPPVAQKYATLPTGDAATIAQDLATIESFSAVDPKVAPSFQSMPKDTRYDRWAEAVSLVEQCFEAHPTFRDGKNVGVVRACIHNCFDEAGSSAKCMDVLTWICTAPANEGVRKAILKSQYLGGYIKGAFKDWLHKFDALSKVPLVAEVQRREVRSGGDDFDEIDRLFRQGGETVAYQNGGSQADIEAQDRLLHQMRELVGDTHIKPYARPGIGYFVEVAECASVAYILSQHCRVVVDPMQFRDIDCDENLRELCIWTVAHNAWGKDIAEEAEPGQWFLDHLEEILEDYLQEG